MYIKVGRRVNRDVHQIHKALGEGQYELSRHGTVVKNEAGTVPKIYLEENLQKTVSSSLTAVPSIFRAVLVLTAGIKRFVPDQMVYVKGERGVDPAPYKIHQVLDDGKYHLSKDGKLELKEDRVTPKEFSEDGLQNHQ